MKKYTLPQMDHVFSIQAVGEETGINWVGDFTYRRPTLWERSQIDVMRARLNGDMTTLDQNVATFNEAIAHLRYTLKESPEWWKEADAGGALYDANIVSIIYNKCMEFEKKWLEKLYSGKAEAVEANKNEVQDDKRQVTSVSGAK